MLDDIEQNDLVERAARNNSVPAEVLKRLLALEQQFPNFAAPGVKSDFARQVADIIGQAAKNAPNE